MARILGGEAWIIGEPCLYKDQRFTRRWAFDGWHGLAVTYDDDGVGWDGELPGVDLFFGPRVDYVDLALLALRAAPRL